MRERVAAEPLLAAHLFGSPGQERALAAAAAGYVGGSLIGSASAELLGRHGVAVGSSADAEHFMDGPSQTPAAAATRALAGAYPSGSAPKGGFWRYAPGERRGAAIWPPGGCRGGRLLRGGRPTRPPGGRRGGRLLQGGSPTRAPVGRRGGSAAPGEAALRGRGGVRRG